MSEERIEQLIKAMTLEEKVSMCSGADNWYTKAIPRLGIPALRMTDGPHGARTVSDSSPSTTYPATCFPTGSALAAAWNTDLANRVGQALADETLARGSHILLGPAVNIHRHPLGGRNFEYLSEDPHLAARLAVAYIKGLQSKGVGASVKHFACNNSEFERMTISSEVSERALREIYWPAFQAAVTEAESWTVMSSYNRINGVSSAHNKPMLTDLLKGEWGFNGFVVSDWGGVYDRTDAANAGCDLEMPGRRDTVQFDQLLAAVKSGKVSENAIDDKVRRILRIIDRAGLFEGKKAKASETTNTPERQALAREAACEAMVLLKNDNNLLPLNEKTIKSIAVIGPAATAGVIEGGGSSRVNPYYVVTPLDGIKKRCPASTKLAHEPGCTIDGTCPPLDATMVSVPGRASERGFLVEYYDNGNLIGGPVAARTETTIAVDSGRLSEIGLADKDYSIRWSGVFMAPANGWYPFSLAGFGRSRLLIDGKTVVDNWDPPVPAPFTPLPVVAAGKMRMAAGKTHDVVIEYSRNDEAMPSLQAGCALPAPHDAMTRAVSLAAQCDVALVFVGLPDRFESEGYDRPDMELTGDQAALIKKVAAANKNTVVVLTNGAPVNMLPWAQRVDAILEAWYAGQETGNAVAAILFGDVNPSGKLPDTFPRRLEDTPTFINYPGESEKVHYGEGIFVGYRYYEYANVAPLFPFGHGLSYTEFTYGNVRTNHWEMAGAGALDVSVDVTNTGQRAGQEVVQLYVADEESAVPRPFKELKGFQKIHLLPGETKTVTFTLTAKDLAYYDPVEKAWIAEPGDFAAFIGSSSADIRAAVGFRLTAEGTQGDTPLRGLGAHSRIAEILASSEGRAVLRKHLGALRQIPLRYNVSYTLSQLARFQPDRLPLDLLKKIEADLKKI